MANQQLSLNTNFDKIFYINLNMDIARNEHMILEFEKWGITNYERVTAIKLKELPEIRFYRNMIKNDYKYVMGSLSCRASLVKCIKLARERGYKRVLILEDDVEFVQDPHLLLAQNAAILQNWDMLYFAGLVEP